MRSIILIAILYIPLHSFGQKVTIFGQVGRRRIFILGKIDSGKTIIAHRYVFKDLPLYKPKRWLQEINKQTTWNMDKKQLQERQENIIGLARKFCTEKLDEEYFSLSERLIRKLGRKRSNPLATGHVEVWAAAVIHALGTINFLFDKSSQPYTTVDEINRFFGTNKSTTTGKSKIIRDLLNLGYFDSEFSTSKINKSNPFNNMVMVDGLIVPIDTSPEQHQEIVKQARAEGKDISFTTT